MATPGNINGPNGQSGSLQFTDVSAATYTLSEIDAGHVLLVSSACVITLPATGPAAGFYVEVRRVGVGAVSFAGGGGATVNSTAGATPAIAAQWGSALVTRNDTYWHVGGGI